MKLAHLLDVRKPDLNDWSQWGHYIVRPNPKAKEMVRVDENYSDKENVN